jgi:hypothetical protein
MKLRMSVALIEVGASICFAEFQDFAGVDEFHSFKPGFCGIIFRIVAKGCFFRQHEQPSYIINKNERNLR